MTSFTQFDHIRKSYNLNGFVVTPQIFAKDEIDSVRTVIQRAVHSRLTGSAPVKDRHIGLVTDRYAEQFTQCLNLWEDHTDVAEIVQDLRLTKIAATLLDASTVRLWQDQALFKPSGGAPTYAHQDNAYWPMDTARCVTAWIPLSSEHSSLNTGAMGYVPGSHLAGSCYFQDIAHIDETQLLEANESTFLARPDWQGHKPVYVETDPGTVIWHNGLTVHRALANTSGHPREVFTVVYFADGVKRGSLLSSRADVPHFVTDDTNQRIATGEPLASTRMPIVYETSANGQSRL